MYTPKTTTARTAEARIVTCPEMQDVCKMIRCKMYEARTAEARIVTLTQRRTTRLSHSLMVDSRGGGFA